MKTKKLCLSFFLIAALLLTGCSTFRIPTNADTAFQNFTRCLFQEEVASNTINLHYSLQDPEKYGINESPITLGSFDFNETAALASVENLENALAKFSIHTLSDKNQITHDILSRHIAMAKKNISFYLYEEPLSPITGIHAQLPVLLAEYQFSHQKDVETYLKLLQTLPEYFSSLIRFEQKKSENGLFMSDDVANAVIAQCNTFISMGNDNYLLSTFEERLHSLPSLSAEKTTDFISQNKEILNNSILPAYEKLASAITSLKGTGANKRGLCHFKQGSEFYSFLVASETGSSRTINEIKDLVANQMATDLLDIQTILKENPAMLEANASLSMSPDKILKILESKITSAFPSSASVNVQVKYIPKALEAHLSPAFYLIPAIDNFAENTIYINQSYSLDDMHLFTTLAHEGYPGHLYQTTYFANTNPDPLRTVLNFSGYVEGWATYAEMCSYYLSPLEKPYATLMQKNNSLILGLYAAADIGIHYDGWSLEDTISFFSSYGIHEEATIREIYQYIIGDPSNYLTYYVGYLEILELKKECMKKQGDAFSQKEFHRQILEIGPAPFDVLHKYMLGT